MEASRTIVVGLDGAHFELLQPWIDSGYLENIGILIEDGIRSDLTACLPPVTAPNWKCYSSGLNPGEIGIFWWENFDRASRSFEFPAERTQSQREIWDHLGDANQRICVIGVPLTYPPKEVSGVLVSGGPDCEGQGYTYPETLESRLESEFDYRIHPETSISSDRHSAAEEIHDLIASRFEVGLELLSEQEFDFVQITTFYINVLQHHFWNQDPTKRAWKIVDKYIGELRGHEPEANILLMSDHGANEMDHVLNINTWLERQEYLALERRYRIMKGLAERGFTRRRLRSLTETLGVTSLIKRLLPTSALEKVPQNERAIRKENKAEHVDWSRTTAIASGQGPVYLLDSSVKESLASDLGEINEELDADLVGAVVDANQEYHGKYTAEGPNLLLDQAPNVHIRGSIGRDAILEKPGGSGWRAENKRTGIFCAAGPDADALDPESPSILDLAPTILDLHGIEPPERMDGQSFRR